MERYTEEFKQLVEDSKTALAFSMPLILAAKGTVKLINKKGHMEVGLKGNPMIRLFMLATASAELLARLDAEKEEGEEEVDTMALFLAMFEVASEVSEERRK